jgi:glycerophosphoryl diester phosphodiesterase
MSRRPEIIAHRGSNQLAPENTLAAFRLGWNETDTCELDIQRTREGRLLVIHDASTERTTGVKLQVAEQTACELQQLDAAANQASEWRGEKMPLLEEVLAAMPDDKQLLIEVKTGPEMIPELARVIASSGREDRLRLQSFDYACCVALKKSFPQIPVYGLVHFGTDSPAMDLSWDEILSLALDAGLDGLNPNDTPRLDAAIVEKIHAARLQILVWTIDDVDQARKLIGYGVDGLITNRPGWLKAQLDPAPAGF